MKLSVLPPKKSLRGKRIFLRVDWNVPLDGLEAEDSLKISRSVATVKDLAARGAIVLVATHLGRPKGRELKLSTKHLVRLLEKEYKLPVEFLPEELDDVQGLSKALSAIRKAHAGSVFLLENVRFYSGEETNAPKLAKAYASLADVFVNDAFASCHRSHASVVGVAKLLPVIAGPTLMQEVEALERLITKPKKPFVAVIGGVKVTTKIGVLEALAKIADRVCVGGAMATAFFAAKKQEIGTSIVEQEGISIARKLLKYKNIVLPTDAVVAKHIEQGTKARTVTLSDMKKTDAIGDIGPETMRAWSAEIKTAQTIVWNGPVGIAEIPTFSHGSLVLGRAIAARSKGAAYGVVGGGDTLPVMLQTGMGEWVDHLSTGGGAMLEFIAKKGKLPGLIALSKKYL